MKMKGAKQVHYDSGPNMTPLVDVVMVILIFLMLAGSFGSTQFLISKQGIHQKGVAGKPDPKAPIETPLDIQINVSASGFVAQGAGLTNTTDPNNLAAQLTAKREKFESTGEKMPEIVLYPGRTVKYEYVIQVYQAVLQAKFEKVAFAASH